jgi:cytochrome c oxidase subunit III
MNVIPAVDSGSQQREKHLNGIYTIGLIATLAFVTVTFAALILVFFLRARVPFNWMPILLPPLLWADTAILVASSFTYEIAHRKLRVNDQRGFYKWMKMTTGLAVVFLIGQLIVWGQVLASGQMVTNNPHSSFFFIFSGLHAAHILVGIAGLATLLYRTHEPASGPRWQMNTRVLTNAVAIFWHYLDALWVVLFILLVLVRR